MTHLFLEGEASQGAKFRVKNRRMDHIEDVQDHIWIQSDPTQWQIAFSSLLCSDQRASLCDKLDVLIQWLKYVSRIYLLQNNIHEVNRISCIVFRGRLMSFQSQNTFIKEARLDVILVVVKYLVLTWPSSIFIFCTNDDQGRKRPRRDSRMRHLFVCLFLCTFSHRMKPRLRAVSGEVKRSFFFTG